MARGRDAVPFAVEPNPIGPRPRTTMLYDVTPRDGNDRRHPVQSGNRVEFYGNGRLWMVVLACNHSVSGRQHAEGTLVPFDREGRLMSFQPS